MTLGIYGAGGLGHEVLDLAQIINLRKKIWDNIIFIDDGELENDVNGVKVYSYINAIEKFENKLEVSMGIGEPVVREKLFEKLQSDGVKIATLIHPDVYIPDTTTIGKGVTIQMGNFISSNVVIHDFVFIQPHANIGHDDVLKKGCIVSGFCNLAGCVTIGEYTYLGISSCFKEKITIGNNAIIAMGSVVYKDIPDGMIAMGNPARPMKRNEERRVFK